MNYNSDTRISPFLYSKILNVNVSGTVSRRRIIIDHYVKYNSCLVHINQLCLCFWCGVLAICSSFCIGSGMYVVCNRDSLSLRSNTRCFPCLHSLFYWSWIILVSNKSMPPPVGKIDTSYWIISTFLLYRKEVDPLDKGRTVTYHCFISCVWHYLRNLPSVMENRMESDRLRMEFFRY